MNLLIVRPEAASFAESFLTCASPITVKSGVFALSPVAVPSSDQVRNPNDLMRSFSRFSAIGEFCGGGARLVGVAHRHPHRDLRVAALRG